MRRFAVGAVPPLSCSRNCAFPSSEREVLNQTHITKLDEIRAKELLLKVLLCCAVPPLLLSCLPPHRFPVRSGGIR